MDCEDEWLLGDVDDPISGGGSLSNPILFEDRMISDSVEYEHSYSNNGPPSSPPVTAPIGIIIKAEKDLDDECYPAVSLSSATGQGVFVKRETPATTRASTPAKTVSPNSVTSPPYTAHVVHNVTPSIVSGKILCCTTSSSNGQGSKASKNCLLANALSTPPLASLLKQTPTQILPISVTQVKVDLPLPPTPPSSTSSSNESESDGSASPLHPGTTSTLPGQQLVNALKRTVSVRTESYSGTPSSCTTPSVLFLTEEEKRTLIAEGYPVPQKLPLTKAEERSLKKIRRKIKNKISAQESRRKKKEYVDALERKVEQLSADSRDMRRLCDSLDEANKILRQQLSLLQQRSAKGTAIVVEAVGVCDDNPPEDQDVIIDEQEVLPEPIGEIIADDEIIHISGHVSGVDDDPAMDTFS